MQQLKLPRRCWVTKHASENCGVGLTLQHWKKQDDNACPCCGLPEDSTHVLQCQACGANTIWEDNFQKLEKLLEDSHTHPDIQSAILQRLSEFHFRSPHVPIYGLSSAAACATQEQDTICLLYTSPSPRDA